MEASMRLLAVVAFTLAFATPSFAQTGAPTARTVRGGVETTWPNQREADFVMRNFRFASGETLAELRLHYLTIGTAQRNAAGAITNGVLLLHGTGGTSASWLQATLAGELFGAGQPLDANRYFLVIPDGIGAGRSSKPSNGLRDTFPQYRYRDMVEAQYRLLTDGLGIRHLRLVIGTSMGGMHTWLWGEMYPDFMDGLVPLASQPTAMSGRNWLARRIRIEAIKNAPDAYMYTLPLAQLMTESVVRLQEMAPTREAADALYRKMVEDARRNDPMDQLYVVEASMDYDPSPELGKIRAPLLAINFADDAINPPELRVVEPAVAKIPHATFVLIPAGPDTHGHYTYFRAAIWKSHLAAFMNTLEARQE
ncbi:MAG: alpha/beta fold hydrolase [Acidobacteria bacterium]|nr:alpha/beta fold hydrolase [Acidobacteriota bacterium]